MGGVLGSELLQSDDGGDDDDHDALHVAFRLC